MYNPVRKVSIMSLQKSVFCIVVEKLFESADCHIIGNKIENGECVKETTT